MRRLPNWPKIKNKKKFWCISKDRYLELHIYKEADTPLVDGIKKYQMCLIDVCNVDKDWKDCKFSYCHFLDDDRSKWNSNSVNLGKKYAKIEDSSMRKKRMITLLMFSK